MKHISRSTLDRDVVGAALAIFEEALALELYLDHWHAIVITTDGDVRTAENITRSLSREEFYGRVPHNLTIAIPTATLDFSTLDPADRAARSAKVEAHNWYYGTSEEALGVNWIVTEWLDKGNCPRFIPVAMPVRASESSTVAEL